MQWQEYAFHCRIRAVGTQVGHCGLTVKRKIPRYEFYIMSRCLYSADVRSKKLGVQDLLRKKVLICIMHLVLPNIVDATALDAM